MSTSSRAQAHLALDGEHRPAHPRCHRPRCWRGRSSNGSFGLWSVGGDDAWLDAYVTDFLTRARERGFAVPDTAFKLALDRLRNFVGTAQEPVQGRRPRSRLCALCAGAQRRRAARRPALSRRRQARRSRQRRSPRRRSPRRWACSATGRAPSASMRRRSMRIAPQPQLGAVGRADYGSTLRDAAALVTLASRRRRAAADHRSAPCSGSSRRARTRPTPRRRRTPGWCWPRARWRRTRAACRSTSPASNAEGALYRNLQARRSVAAPLQIDQHRRRPAAGGGVGDRRADHAGAGGRAAASRSSGIYYTLDGEPADPSQGQAEPALRRGAARSPSRSRSSAASSSPTICRRASRSTIRGWCRRARPARCLDRERERAGALGIPRRPLQRGVRARRDDSRCLRWPMWCARCRRAATCCRRPMSRTCTGLTASAAPPRARSRSRRDETLATHTCSNRRNGRHHRGCVCGWGLCIGTRSSRQES